MRYRGTDIDGVTLDPDGLEVRGLPVPGMIGAMTLPQAVVHLLAVDLRPEAVDAALCAGLGRIGPEHPAARIAALAAQSGAGMSRAVMAGLAGLADRDVEPVSSALGLAPAGVAEGLAATGAIPALIAAWRGRWPEAGQGGFAARARALCSPVPDPGPAAERLLEDVLVAWLGGFGYLPPSVMIPRLAIGTGVPIAQAVAAGFGAAGPNHIGATEQATALLLAAARLPEDPARAMAAVLAQVAARGSRVGGFGHPLLNRDPRPPRLRARAAELGLTHPVLALYDAAVAQMAGQGPGLAPNIDFATGMAAVAAGIDDPGAAAGLAMTARSLGMLAHVLERRARPAFGVTRATARAHLDSLPTGWL